MPVLNKRMFVVALCTLLLLIGSVFALQKGKGIIGSGTDDDPYTIGVEKAVEGGTEFYGSGAFGVTEDCTVRVLDNDPLTEKTVWIQNDGRVAGDGSREHPFEIEGTEYGIVCLFGDKVERAYVGELVQRGQTSATTSPSCKEHPQRCKEIDQVWLSISPLLRTFAIGSNIGKVWDTVAGWKSLRELYEVAKGTTTPSTTPSTPTPEFTGDIFEQEQVKKDLQQGLYQREFIVKVQQISQELGINPFHLLAIMRFESGGKFSSSSVNPTTGATGLIQFIPSTAQRLGTTTGALAAMTQMEQLNYVRVYFLPYKGKMHNFGDVAMAVFTPTAIGKPDSYVMYTQGTAGYNNNRGLDKNNDGSITRQEYLCTAASHARLYGITINC